METKEKIKPPKYKDGTLICPHCNLPLVGVEETYFKIRCFICNGIVDKIPIKIMKKMFDDTPASLLKEWLIEMKSVKGRI